MKLRSWLLIIVILSIIYELEASRYYYPSYRDIIKLMGEMAYQYPRYCKMIDITKEIPNLDPKSCGSEE